MKDDIGVRLDEVRKSGDAKGCEGCTSIGLKRLRKGQTLLDSNTGYENDGSVIRATFQRSHLSIVQRLVE